MLATAWRVLVKAPRGSPPDINLRGEAYPDPALQQSRRSLERTRPCYPKAF
jgi:hypothetical protein